jgi:hypothetical protein
MKKKITYSKVYGNKFKKKVLSTNTHTHIPSNILYSVHTQKTLNTDIILIKISIIIHQNSISNIICIVKSNCQFNHTIFLSLKNKKYIITIILFSSLKHQLT